MELQDISYEVDNGLATITICREKRMNAFRAETVDELIKCFKRAWADPEVGVVCLTGAGDRAFCAGGDQKERAETGSYGKSESGLFEILALQRVIRDIPKPVIAAVESGSPSAAAMYCTCCATCQSPQIMHVLAKMGRAFGSFDAGWGTGLLARIVGEKRAREIWFMCRQYDAASCGTLGLGQCRGSCGTTEGRGAEVGGRNVGDVAHSVALPQTIAEYRHRALRRYREPRFDRFDQFRRHAGS